MKQHGYSKRLVMQVQKYHHETKKSGAAVARHFGLILQISQKRMESFTRQVQRWIKMPLKDRMELAARIDTGEVSLETQRIRVRVGKYPELDKRLKKRLDNRIEKNLPRGKRYINKRGKQIAIKLEIRNFVCSDTFIARFLLRCCKSLKKKTTTRATTIYEFLEKQVEWIEAWRERYGGDERFYIGIVLRTDKASNYDEVPYTPDSENEYHVENDDSKVVSVLEFQCTFDVTKVMFHFICFCFVLLCYVMFYFILFCFFADIPIAKTFFVVFVFYST